MKVSTSAFVAALCMASTNAFTVVKPSTCSTSLKMSEAVMEEVVAEEETIVIPDAPPAELSGLRMKDVRKAVEQLTVDNFVSTLETIEPFLLNEAGSAIYSKSMKRIARRANALGVEIATGYAKEAQCTEKKRTKQHAFIQQKEEERMAAEAEAAEAAAAAAAEEAASEEQDNAEE